MQNISAYLQYMMYEQLEYQLWEDELWKTMGAICKGRSMDALFSFADTKLFFFFFSYMVENTLKNPQ